MQTARFSQLLPLLTDIEETHEAFSAVQVWTFWQNLFVNDSEKAIVMFSCKNNLQFFSSIDGLYVDGTFKSTPKFFHQIFTIQGLTMCNLHFSCRPKTSNVLWEYIQTYGIRGCKIWCECFPAVVFADFETAIHNAVTTVWSDLEVKACHFHLGQSWWRKIQSLGLSRQYGKKDSEVSQFLKKIFGL